MNGLIAALRLLAASQVLLFACVLLTPGSAAKLRVPGIVLSACVIAYLLIPLTAPYLGAAVAVAGLLANAIPPALFWFTWAVFEDRPGLPRAFVVAAFAYLAMVLVLWPSGTPGGPPVVIGAVVQSFKLGFAVAAIVLIWRGRHGEAELERLHHGTNHHRYGRHLRPGSGAESGVPAPRLAAVEASELASCAGDGCADGGPTDRRADSFDARGPPVCRS